jgi:hypothetical protein
LKENEMNVYFLLDSSGSMASIWDESISSSNGYIKNLDAAVSNIAFTDEERGMFLKGQQ